MINGKARYKNDETIIETTSTDSTTQQGNQLIVTRVKA